MKINPKIFGLPAKTHVEQVNEDTIALVMHRKSRIIMADGHRIVKKIAKIKETSPEANVIFKTSAPLCSKTNSFLEDQGIIVLLSG